MANPATLQVDTKLYCAAEPDGRVFPAGSPWPGDAWSDKVGGAPIGGDTVAQAAKDLLKAQEAIDSLSTQLQSKDHDLAVMAADRDAANGRVADLEQRALAAEKGQADADDAARGYMTERDAARADVQRLTDENAKLTADLEAATAPDQKSKG